MFIVFSDLREYPLGLILDDAIGVRDDESSQSELPGLVRGRRNLSFVQIKPRPLRVIDHRVGFSKIKMQKVKYDSRYSL